MTDTIDLDKPCAIQEIENNIGYYDIPECQENLTISGWALVELLDEVKAWRESHKGAGSFNPTYCAARDALKEHLANCQQRQTGDGVRPEGIERTQAELSSSDRTLTGDNASKHKQGCVCVNCEDKAFKEDEDIMTDLHTLLLYAKLAPNIGERGGKKLHGYAQNIKSYLFELSKMQSLKAPLQEFLDAHRIEINKEAGNDKPRHSIEVYTSTIARATKALSESEA